MAKRILMFFEICIVSLLLTGSVLSQDCTTTISLGSLSLERNVKTFVLPVNIENPCPIGGIHIFMTTDPPGIITPVMADTSGSRIAGWEQFDYHNSQTNPDSFIVFGVANMPDGFDTPPLEPGDGLLFNVTIQFECGWEDCTTVDVVMGPVFICDTSGYNNYEVIIENGVVEINESTARRGDTNCDSLLIGSDVTYLVNYFLGNVGCPCTLCAGDPNGDDRILGSDVTYLVNYFRGINPVPGPCDSEPCN